MQWPAIPLEIEASTALVGMLRRPRVVDEIDASEEEEDIEG